MPRRVERIVIFPRYTPLIGTGPVYSVPIDVRAYMDALLVGWQGTGLGASPSSVEFTPQRTMDFEKWVDEASLTPAANTESTLEIGIYYPWIRVKAEVAGVDPGVCCWLVGEFVRREGPAAGEAA